MPLAQTITVVNKSGKVVKTSKTLVNVFKEAKTAYLERKAEIKAIRSADLDEGRARKALDRLEIRDDRHHRRRDSGASSRQSSTSTIHRKPVPPNRPQISRVHTDSSARSDSSDRASRSPRSPRSPHVRTPSHLRFEDTLASLENESTGRELVRRKTDSNLHDSTRRRSSHGGRSSRSASLTDIESSLAYGELPPPLPLRPLTNERELRLQVTKLQQLLDEANCVGHSVGNMIDSLQKNPDQLAAVALTLGEISTLAAKMAPGALMSLKGAFPAVVALLAAPEFMIAAGVGVGVTIIAFGGYKIIKRVKARRERNNAKAITAEGGDDEEMDADELQEIRSDLSRIEVWRRGLAEAQAESVGTSVDGEFITPAASQRLMDEGKLSKRDLKKKDKSERKEKVKLDKEEEKRRKREDHLNVRQGRIEDENESLLGRGKALIRDPTSIKSLFKSSSSTVNQKEMSLA